MRVLLISLLLFQLINLNLAEDLDTYYKTYIETFGYPLIEAKKMGAIILASDCDFSHELLDGYENAYFFNPFSADELYKLMKAVLSGDIVRKNTQNEFTISRNASTWQLVIDEILLVANKYNNKRSF